MSRIKSALRSLYIVMSTIHGWRGNWRRREVLDRTENKVSKGTRTTTKLQQWLWWEEQTRERRAEFASQCYAYLAVKIKRLTGNWAGAAQMQAPTATNYDINSHTWWDLTEAPLLCAMEATSLGHGPLWSPIDPVLLLGYSVPFIACSFIILSHISHVGTLFHYFHLHLFTGITKLTNQLKETCALNLNFLLFFLGLLQWCFS